MKNKTLYCSVYTALMASVYLLFFWTRGYSAITLPKYILFCILTGAFIIVMSLSGGIPGRLTLTEAFVVAYWLFSLISALLSAWKEDAFAGGSRYEGVLTISMYAAVFLMISRHAAPSRAVGVISAVCVGIFCVLCFVQLGGANPFRLYPEGLNWYDGNKSYSGQYIGTVGNAGLAAALLCMTAAFFAVLALRSTAKLYLIPAVMSAAVLIFIRVDAGLAGLLAGGLLCLHCVFPKHRRVLLAAAALVLLAAAALIYFHDFGGTLGQAHELMHGRADDSFGSGRIFIWRNVIPLIGERPLFGGGPDTLSRRMTVYFSRGDIIRSIDAAHNEYLNILVNQGIFALTAYLSAVMTALVNWYKNKSAAAAAAGAAVLCYCVQAFFGISMFIVTIFFWIALAYLERENRSAGLSKPLFQKADRIA